MIISRKNINILLVLLILILNSVIVNAVYASEPRNIKISNISKDKFTVSWITDIQEGGRIAYGNTASLGNIAYDVRGESFEGITHYVIVAGLASNTAYYYDIISGGATYDNSGAHYTVTTGAILSPSADTDIAYGQVFLSDGITPAEGAIVYITLRDGDNAGTSGDSQLCSSLVGSAGYWYFNLKNVRNQALDSYFNYSGSGDKLVLNARGPNGEIASQLVDTSQDSPASSMTLVLSQTLGLSIDRTDWQLLNIAASSAHITDNATKITVTNIGNGLETYSLQITNEGGNWLSSSDKNGADLNTYVLSALFTEDSISAIDSTYVNELANDDVILAGSSSRGSAARFGSTRTFQNGSSVSSGEARKLWLEFKAPTQDTTRGAAHSIEVTITAEIP